MLRDQFDLNMGIEMGSKGIGLVAAQLMIEANSRMINGMPSIHCRHTHKCAGVGSKGIGLVAAQLMIEANSRMINGMRSIHYSHTYKRTGVRASVRACRRASVRARAKLNFSVDNKTCGIAWIIKLIDLQF